MIDDRQTINRETHTERHYDKVIDLGKLLPMNTEMDTQGIENNFLFLYIMCTLWGHNCFPKENKAA